jgi:DNA-binding XRE family transcriptional regulator
MEKKFTQDQIADALGVQKYIVAAWEKQFDIIPLQEDSDITYTIQNLESFRTIKELLYEKGLTMAAVKKSLQDTHVIFEGKTLMAATPLFFDVKKAAQRESEISSEKLDPAAVTSKLLHIRSQLMKISSSL